MIWSNFNKRNDDPTCIISSNFDKCNKCMPTREFYCINNICAPSWLLSSMVGPNSADYVIIKSIMTSTFHHLLWSVDIKAFMAASEFEFRNSWAWFSNSNFWSVDSTKVILYFTEKKLKILFFLQKMLKTVISAYNRKWARSTKKKMIPGIHVYPQTCGGSASSNPRIDYDENHNHCRYTVNSVLFFHLPFSLSFLFLQTVRKIHSNLKKMIILFHFIWE